LAGAGLSHFLRNLEHLISLPDAEFVTASTAPEFLADGHDANAPIASV
jgi:hypothetical protein